MTPVLLSLFLVVIILHTMCGRIPTATNSPEIAAIINTVIQYRCMPLEVFRQKMMAGWVIWLAPRDSELASELARKAASVSQDGEYLHGAQLLTAIQRRSEWDPIPL
jgi:hypothetical protein